MIRGKLPTEQRPVPKFPPINILGQMSRLKPGEKVLFELEVVSAHSHVNASIDFVSLNTDLNFSGMFKANAVRVVREGIETSIDDIVTGNKIISDTCIEFYTWVKEGNVPLEVEFNRHQMLIDFKAKYPNHSETLLLSNLSAWLSRYAKRLGYWHNPKCRGGKAWSLIVTKRTDK